MKRFISSVVFALTIVSGTASFAQSPLPAESNKGVPDSTASDTVDVQHVIDAYHEAVLTHDGSRLARLLFRKAVRGSTCFLMTLTLLLERNRRMR
jgi:hypothetical protein